MYICERPSTCGFDLATRRGVRIQLKCIVRKRLVDESGIGERYERYIAKAVIDGTINYTPISFDAIHSVCALPEPSKNTELFNLLYTLNGFVTAAQFHLFTNWNRYSGKIDTKKQHRNYYLCGSAYCMFSFITIIKPTIIPSIRTVRQGLLFCEPNAIRLIWLGYKCNLSLKKHKKLERPSVVSVCVCRNSLQQFRFSI